MVGQSRWCTLFSDVIRCHGLDSECGIDLPSRRLEDLNFGTLSASDER